MVKLALSGLPGPSLYCAGVRVFLDQLVMNVGKAGASAQSAAVLQAAAAAQGHSECFLLADTRALINH